MIKLHNSASFCQQIEKMVAEEELSYIEAICEFCTRTGFDTESIPRLLSPALKAKIESEAIDLNMFKKKKKHKKLPMIDVE